MTDLHTVLAWLSNAADWLDHGLAPIFVSLYITVMLLLFVGVPAWFWGYDKGSRDLQDRDADAWRFGYSTGWRDHECGAAYAIKGETVRHIILMRTDRPVRP